MMPRGRAGLTPADLAVAALRVRHIRGAGSERAEPAAGRDSGGRHVQVGEVSVAPARPPGGHVGRPSCACAVLTRRAGGRVWQT